MPYISTVGDQAYHIDMNVGEEQQGEQGEHVIMLGDKQLPIDWRQIAALAMDARGNTSTGGRYSLIIAGTSYDIFARRITKTGEKASQTYEVQIGAQRFEVKVEDERAKLLAGLVKHVVGTGEATVNAPMPGLVVNVPVEPGTSVTAGQIVVVLEAMKMENDLAAPIAGVVKEVRVNKGQTVDQGEVLVVVTAE